jgi:hypothetical protein
MAKIPESCPPVNARTQFESALLQAEASLRQTLARWLTDLLVAIVQHVLNHPYHRRRSWLPRLDVLCRRERGQLRLRLSNRSWRYLCDIGTSNARRAAILAGLERSQPNCTTADEKGQTAPTKELAAELPDDT